MARRFLALVTRLIRDLTPVERAVLFGVALLHVIGLTWGLPASDGWDVDGVAPRGFLPGVIFTFTPGQYNTYPPLHLLFLAVLTLPITLVTLARAPSLGRADVIGAFVEVPVMTAFSFIARVVSLVMALGILLVVADMSGSIFGKRARPWAMAIAGVEVACTYYAHATNLDIPALFWSSLSLRALLRAVQADEPKRLRSVAVYAAMAIATKDQAYAMFALSVPIALAAWLYLSSGPRRSELVRATFRLGLTVVALVLVLGGAVFNPTGFIARVRFLTGPASQDFAQFSHDWPGRLAALKAAATFLPMHYPTVLAPLFGLGVAFAVLRTRGRERVAALVPLLAIVSFTLAFNCVARRVEERFMMPQMQLLAVYGGGAVCVVLELGAVARHRALTWAVRLAAFAGIAAGVRLSASIVATMLNDSRYDAERYLEANVRADDRIEVYGSNLYLPRFPRSMKVERVGPGPTERRSRIPGIVEVQDRIAAVEDRRPRWIVVSTGYAWTYLQRPYDPFDGRVLPTSQAVVLADTESTDYVRALFGGHIGYRVAHVAHYAGSSLLPPHPMHASLACDVWVFERR